MKWQKVTLNIPVESDTDILGNRKAIRYDAQLVRGRMTNWTLEEKAALDPAYTRTTRKLILPQSSKAMEAESVTIDGYEYQIVERFDLQRWFLLHIRSYKQGATESKDES